jgi:hypothetical protein
VLHGKHGPTDAFKPLDMTKILGSPHKLPKDFKEWLPIFSGEDLIMTEDHLDFFLRALEPYDQHEDVLMRLFSYTFVGKSKEWYDSTLPGTITNWDLFRELLPKYLKRTKTTNPFMINSTTTREIQGKV